MKFLAALLLVTLTGGPLHAQPISDADRAAIDQALPAVALVQPMQPRHLLIYDVNVGYPGHPSRFQANVAFQRMGEKTGAYRTTVSRDPSIFQPERLKAFDAVFLNNTVGNLFEDSVLRNSLLEFVLAGGGVLGCHGTSVAFTRWPGAHEDWPEFGRLIGGRGARHRESDERVFIKLDHPDHPLNAPFDGRGFEYRDEFFRVHEPYSRNRVRVLFSIDVNQTDLTPKDPRWQQERADQDYALAWVRNYGRGRVFYSTVGHNPKVFHDPRMLTFYLGAIQFALGDLAAPTLPSGRLTPAKAARENQGWRLGMTAYTFHKYTLFEAIDKTEELGLSYLGGLSFQRVSDEIPKPFDARLSDEELRQVRFKLDDAGVRMVTHYYAQFPEDEAECRRVFEFGRKLGIETFISEPPPEALDQLEALCDAFGINLAIHNHDQRGSPVYWNPKNIVELCKDRSPRIGACADLGYWMRSGIDPVAGIRTLGNRLITVQLHDLHELSPEGHDVPWGTGVGRLEEVVHLLRELQLKPTLFGLEYSYDWTDNMPEAAECIRFFDHLCLPGP